MEYYLAIKKVKYALWDKVELEVIMLIGIRKT